MIGHVPEIGGHDAETVGHALPKYAEMNRILPDAIATRVKDASIVEIGFMGNVLREFYRIDLADGTGFDATNGKAVRVGK